MTFVRVVCATSICNSWERKAPEIDKLAKSFFPSSKSSEDGAGNEYWSDVSVFLANSWVLQRACAAAVKYSGAPDKWAETCLVLRIEEDLIEQAGIEAKQTSFNDNGKPQTIFTNLNQFHYDIRGTKTQFNTLVESIYRKHRENGNSIVPVSFSALFEGCLALHLHSDIQPEAKKDSVGSFLSKQVSEAKLSSEYPDTTSTPF